MPSSVYHLNLENDRLLVGRSQIRENTLIPNKVAASTAAGVAMVKPPRTRQMRNEDFASGKPISTDYVVHNKIDVQKAYNYKKLHTKKDYIMIPKGTVFQIRSEW